MNPPELLTPSAIGALLSEYGIRPSRALGQNFLADPNTARRIVRLAAIHEHDAVVEVGPGIGSLTLALAEAGACITALELDRFVVRVLEQVTAGLGVTIVSGDAMTVDWAALLKGGEAWAMVSNLPYNVATPVVLRALESAPMIDRYLVMVQREVGERMAAPVGSAAYGAVSVKVAYFAHAEVVGTVSPNVFVPRPKVDSALVRLQRRVRPAVEVPDEHRLFALVKAGFATRRKTLRNALGARLGPRADAVLTRAGIDPGARAETLTLDDWAALAHAEWDEAQ